MHRMIEVRHLHGLTDVLRGIVPLDETIAPAAEVNLRVLSIGRSREAAIDLSNSARMKALLDELERAPRRFLRGAAAAAGRRRGRRRGVQARAQVTPRAAADDNG
jgi:hypothetical protein